MKLCERKAPLNDMLNGTSYKLLYLNVWSKLELTPMEVVFDVMDTIRHATNGNTWARDNLEKFCIKPSYFKVSQKLDDRGEGYDYNLIIDISTVQGVSYNGYRCFVDYLRRLSTAGLLIYDGSKTEAVIREIGSKDAVSVRVGTTFVDNYVSSSHGYTLDDAAISIETVYDNDKKYNLGMSIKYSISVYDTLSEAFANKSSKTIAIHGSGGSYTFKQLKNDRTYSVYEYNLTYDNKLKSTVVGNKLVFYDGEKAFKEFLPYITQLDNKIRIIDITQFTTTKDLYYQVLEDRGIRKITLNFLNVDHLSINPRNRQFSDGGCRLSGSVVSSVRKNKKSIKRKMEIRITPDSNYYASLIVPINNGVVNKEDLERIVFLLNESFKTNRDNDKFHEAVLEYRKSLYLDSVTEGDDVLSRWFSMCTTATVDENKNIVKSYVNMKRNLLKEYEDLKVYVKHYDFSKCTPIPKIIIDEDMLKGYYKSLQIEPKNIIMNTINYKNIEKIQEVQPRMTVSVYYKGDLIYGEYPLSKFVNVNANTINLNYKELRGAVLNDKVKNRR